MTCLKDVIEGRMKTIVQASFVGMPARPRLHAYHYPFLRALVCAIGSII
jgi:hypothetical protein